MAINLNRTLPAAPAGSTNVKWQSDVSGNVSGYVTAPNSVPSAAVDLTAQAANIAPASLITSPTAGVYRISAYIVITQIATTSCTLPSIVLTWQDQDSGTSQSLTLTPTSSVNALTTYEQALAILSANTSAIQYSTTGYASSGGTPMQYAVHIRVEQL